ncbi:MAG: DUF2141 domain-containing protein [Acidobacteriaceae bacterium]
MSIRKALDLALFLFTLVFALQAQAPSMYTLTIHMTGFRNNIGNGGVAIFKSPDGWPENNDKAFQHSGVQVENGQATLKFEVPAGTYAIAALHDENKNHKLDRNLIGYPKEGFGFANNPHVGLKAPAFNVATVKVTGNMTVEIRMQYK